VIHPSIRALTNHAAKLAVEEAIYESGMKFTVLQPAMFMQNLDNGWPHVVNTGRFSLPFSKYVKTSYVDYRDVAEAAAVALTSDKLDYGTFELWAPGMVDRIEIAAMMSEALARKIEAAEIPFDEWVQIANIPPGPLREGLNRMHGHYDQYGLVGGNALVLEGTLGRAPRTLKNYIRDLGRQSFLTRSRHHENAPDHSSGIRA
jgi:uncharacterized protein YbjT (DUF2867 family)